MRCSLMLEKRRIVIYDQVEPREEI